jgi:hypothetical protein
MLARLGMTLTLGAAAWLALAAGHVLPQGVHGARLIAAGDDPAAISDVALDRTFNEQIVRREIETALAANDAELARSFVDLANERGVPVDPALAETVNAAEREANSTIRKASNFVHGFVTGEPEDIAGFAGTITGDLFVFGDIRDMAREGSRMARGAESDKLVMALAGAGLAVTAGTYVTAGLAAPARAGVSIAKVAARSGRIGTKLARAIKLQKTDGIVKFASDVGRMQSKVGTRAALDGLRIAQEPKDMARLARLADVKGSKTRAVMKVLGRGAIAVGTTLANLASWVFWALFNLIGLVIAFKRFVERTTLRHLQRAKLRKARRALREKDLAKPAAAEAPKAVPVTLQEPRFPQRRLLRLMPVRLPKVTLLPEIKRLPKVTHLPDAPHGSPAGDAGPKDLAPQDLAPQGLAARPLAA